MRLHSILIATMLFLVPAVTRAEESDEPTGDANVGRPTFPHQSGPLRVVVLEVRLSNEASEPVTDSLTQLMVETLERLGYLEKVAAGCEQSCEHCAQYPACLPNESPQIWKLTGKGERYLAADHEVPD